MGKISVKALIIRNDKVLLLRPKNLQGSFNGWDGSGSRVEVRENILKREVLEENKIKIDQAYPIKLLHAPQLDTDYLISSLPLDYVASITNPLSQELKENSGQFLHRLGIVVINLVFKGDYDLKGTAIYFPEKEFIFRRVSILQNLCPALKRKGLTPISVEISVNPKKKINKNDLLKTVLDDLVKVKQFAQLGSPIASEFLDIEFAYPLQVNGLSEYVEKLHEYYASYNVYHCGRGGKFDYCNLDQAYKQGKDMVRGILQQKRNEA